MKVLMVCLGNICRSPLAEGILTDLVRERGLDWEVDSAGTGSWHVGEPPDPRSAGIAAKYGHDISHLRARQFHFPDLENFDIIYAMDSSNYTDILRQAKGKKEREKVRLIMNEAEPGRNINVPDPYWDDDGFEKVYRMLRSACERIIEEHG